MSAEIVAPTAATDAGVATAPIAPTPPIDEVGPPVSEVGGPKRQRRRPRRPRPRLEACPNCAHPTAPTHHYCASCGQAAKHPDASLVEILADASDEFIKVDSRFVKTIIPLLFRPGFLTREYMLGRRVRYIAPFKLYLTISFLFFLAVTYRSTAALTAALGADISGQNLQQFADRVNGKYGGKSAGADAENTGADIPGASLSIDPNTAAQMPKVNINMGSGRTKLPESVEDYERAQARLPFAKRDTPTRQFLMKHAIGIKSRSPMDVISDFFNTASKTMILLLPLYALLLKVLYIRRRRSYVEHFVFALHIHSALFVAATLYLLLPLPHEAEILTLAFFVYGLVALRTVYRQSFVKTVLKAILLFFNYAIVFVVALTLTFCLSILF